MHTAIHHRILGKVQTGLLVLTGLFMVGAFADNYELNRGGDSHPTLNIVETAVAADDFNILVAALQATGLDDALANEHAEFTVFAPTDAAFNALGSDTIKALLADPDTLSSILLYHVLGDERPSSELLHQIGQDIQTLNGETIALSLDGGSLFINDSQVVIADIQTTNGVIHVIDAVLLPPAPPAGPLNIVETAVAAGGFETLVAALQATGLDQALADENSRFTVFAPTDAAFAVLGDDVIAGLLADTDTLSDILLYHVANGERDSNDLTRRDGRALRTLNSDRLAINVTDEGLYLNQSLVVVANIEASNGIIHVIDRVLLPVSDEVANGTIVDVAVASGQFTTLVAALQATGLDRVLALPWGRFTVFAPTDDAFAALGQDTINDLLANPDVLADILLYHVAWGNRDSVGVLKRVKRNLRMLNRDRVDVRIVEGEIFINDSQVIIKDIATHNGTIHVIDAVLIPPSH